MLQFKHGNQELIAPTDAALTGTTSAAPSQSPMKSGMKSFAHRLWEAWKPIARKIGDFQARLLLTLFYIFAVGPFALLIRWRGDPLGLKKNAPRGWHRPTERPGEPMDRATQQF